VTATGDIYSGLWYPIAIAVMSLVVGTLLLKDTDRTPRSRTRSSGTIIPKFPAPSPQGEGVSFRSNHQRRRNDEESPDEGSAGLDGLLASTVALASDSADTGATEMNAGWGTFALLLGGVCAMGVVIFVMLKVMNRKK